LQWQRPQPSDEQLASIYSTYYFIGSDDEAARSRKLEMKRINAVMYLDIIETFSKSRPGKLLEVGCGQGEFLVEALKRGYAVTGVEYSSVACQTARESLARVADSSSGFKIEQGELETANLPEGEFDLCVLNDVIEHVREPHETIARIRQLLRPGGLIFIATPSLDSWSSKLMGKLWMEYKEEHLFFFSKKSLTRMLESQGFAQISMRPGYKILTPEYVAEHFRKFLVPGFSALVRGCVWLLPASLRRRQIRLVASGIIALARAGDQGTTKRQA
jgi:2-polyprenyl-3-methyl-5-hydroxy-6-metoxy-1,4-benzoquinol methylase